MAECASKDEIILECDDLQRIILKLNALTPGMFCNLCETLKL